MNDLWELIFLLSVPSSILIGIGYLNRRADRRAQETNEAALPPKPTSTPAR